MIAPLLIILQYETQPVEEVKFEEDLGGLGPDQAIGEDGGGVQVGKEVLVAGVEALDGDFADELREEAVEGGL